MRNKPLPGMMKHSPMKQKLTIDSVDLPDLRKNDKNIDLDKATNMPVKTSGFGPSTSFGNVKNLELTKK